MSAIKNMNIPQLEHDLYHIIIDMFKPYYLFPDSDIMDEISVDAIY